MVPTQASAFDRLAPSDDETWVGLFSGGKDSSYAIHLAIEAGIPVEPLVTVHPRPDAYLYHVPATELAHLAATSMGCSLIEVDARSVAVDPAAADSTTQGDAELEPLRDTFRSMDGSIDGLVVGAVESEFQRQRIERLGAEFDAELVTPLWHADPIPTLRQMVGSGFDIRIIHVSAGGFDESWLGRPIDEAAIRELATLSRRYGIHPLGEGGEFETIVTDGPHMSRPIRIDGTPEWEGDRGRFRITDASLEDRLDPR